MCVDLIQSILTLSIAISDKAYASQVVSLGKRFVLGETNSVACSGAPNVSDVFGAALWGIDWMFSWANVNTSGVNFHGPGSYYGPVFMGSLSNQIPSVRPLYYGLYFFVQATQANSALIPINAVSTNSFIKTWAVIDKNSLAIRVIVIHKDMTANSSATVSISLSNSIGINYSTNASIVRLLASNVLSKTGITLAGQTFDGTTDGNPLGTRTTTPIVADSNGVFSFQVDPISAAFLEIVSKSAPTSTRSSSTAATGSAQQSTLVVGSSNTEQSNKTLGSTFSSVSFVGSANSYNTIYCLIVILLVAVMYT